MTRRKSHYKGPSNERGRAMPGATGPEQWKYLDQIAKAINQGFDGRPRNRQERRARAKMHLESHR